MSRIFLGYPSAKIRQFFEEHYADPLKKPLTFTATGDSKVQLTKVGSPAGISLEYSFDGFKTDPIPYTIGTEIELTDGQSVSMRAVSTNDTLGSSWSNYYKFVMSGSIAASGNIQSLLDKTCQRMDVPSYCYRSMFQNCSSLTQAPELPATTLAASHCYASMFYGCTSLTKAPELPATTLAKSCYYGMFDRCSSLTAAPELPATTLASGCYYHMFYICTSLSTAPALPATTLADHCYNSMFFRCSSLTQAPELSATTLAAACYSIMFYGTNISEFTVDMTACTSVPSLPSTDLFSSSNKPYTVLVPASLYDEWIAATNWSAIVNNIQAV